MRNSTNQYSTEEKFYQAVFVIFALFRAFFSNFQIKKKKARACGKGLKPPQ
jgi:hypothetical protein